MKDIKLLDTTIRDGELSPHFNPTLKERLEIAKSLESGGVDIIELSSTADNEDRLKSSRQIVRCLKNTTVCCLSQLSRQDIEIAKTLLDGASSSRIHLYLDAKRVHEIENQNGSYEEIFDPISTIVGMAKSNFSEVEFSSQDVTRVNTESLSRIVEVAFNAGAEIINISDTSGTATPGATKNILDELFDYVPNLLSARLSLHGHNNLGCATENALAAIECGALQIEGTINGVGPAGGNTDLIEVAEIIQQKEMDNQIRISADASQLRFLSTNPVFA